MLSSLFGKFLTSLSLFLSQCGSYYELSSWWKHSPEAAKSEWSKRFVSRHVVFGSLWGIDLCHLQNIIATHMVDELGLLCVELGFRWTIQGSKKWEVKAICFPSCSLWQPLKHRPLSSAKYYHHSWSIKFLYRNAPIRGLALSKQNICEISLKKLCDSSIMIEKASNYTMNA